MHELNSEVRWLLDRASQGGVYVRLLLPETVDQVAQWNVPCPNWTYQAVFLALQELEESELIQFELIERDSGNRLPVSHPQLDKSKLIPEFRHGNPLSYRLTVKGATTWENVATPDWSIKYIWAIHETTSESLTEHVDLQDKEYECVVTACSEDIARRAILVTACGHNLLPVPGTEMYSVCGKWNATYWKTIDAGVSGLMTVGKNSSGFHLETNLPLASARRHAESMRMLNKWYVRADGPDWNRDSKGVS